MSVAGGPLIIIVSSTYVGPHARLLAQDGGAGGDHGLALPLLLHVLLLAGESAVDFPAVVEEVAGDTSLEGVGGETEVVLDTVASLGDGGGVLLGLLVLVLVGTPLLGVLDVVGHALQWG